MKPIYFILLFFFSNCVLDEKFLQTEFNSFKQKYNIRYSSKEEEEKKFKIFKRNFEKYEVVNPYSDIIDYEQALEEIKLTKNLPKSVSFVSNFGDAKAQGGCQFCYVFMFVALMEAQYSIKFGKTYRFSEQELLDCSRELKCEYRNYATLEGFFKARNYLALESYYGAFNGKVNEQRCEMLKNDVDKFNNAIKFKYFDDDDYHLKVAMNNPKECFKSLLLKYGPIGVQIDASILDGYKGNQIIRTNVPNVKVDHAVVIVGYQDYEEQDGTTQTYWIVRKSYGKNWGNSGYFNI